MTCIKIFVFVLPFLFSFHAYAANIIIQNNDGDNEGLNDPTPPPHANQIGVTNTADTLGALRMEVLMAAAEVWGDILNSDIDIKVGATFDDDLFCSKFGATLGRAGSTGSQQGFTNSDVGVAYPVALAESLSSSELNGTSLEITAQFNSTVDNNDVDCLEGKGFYYGLDGNAPDGTSALFQVVLHELGHGLGFASMVNNTTGGFNTFPENPDSFSRNLKDLETDKTWVNMNNAERKASSLNEPDLVWTGTQVMADRSLHLYNAPELKINAPAPIGIFEATLGYQSIEIPGSGLNAQVVDGNTFTEPGGDPADGCAQIGFGGTFSGKIVLFDKSDDPGCTAVFQALFSQWEDAVGVIIAETAVGGFPDVSGGILNDITIPYIGVSKAEADQLRSNIGTANVTIQRIANQFAGENQGNLKMHGPAGLEPGSSVSHWSKSATPNLLMEPVFGTLVFENVDLTAAAFRDIGWSVNIPGGVVELIYRDGFE